MRLYVATIKSGQTARAIDNLRRQSFLVIQPTFFERRVIRRRIERVAAPMFPGYLFIAFDVGRPGWAAINSTFGVRRLLLANDGMPMPLPIRVGRELERRFSNGPVADVEIGIDALLPGASLRVSGGSLWGHVGTLVDFSKARDRVNILLSFLGRTQSVNLPLSLVEVA